MLPNVKVTKELFFNPEDCHECPNCGDLVGNEYQLCYDCFEDVLDTPELEAIAGRIRDEERNREMLDTLQWHFSTTPSCEMQAAIENDPSLKAAWDAWNSHVTALEERTRLDEDIPF